MTFDPMMGVYFWGFLVLQSQSLEAIGELFDPDFAIPLIGRSNVLGFFQDVFTALVLLAIVGFALIRFAQHPTRLGRSSRFAGSNLLQGWYVLLAEFALLYTVLVLRAGRAAKGTLPYPEGAFISSWLGGFLDDLPTASLDVIVTAFLVAHLAVLGGFFLFTVHSKHLHIFTIPFNVLFGRQSIASTGFAQAGIPIRVHAVCPDGVDTGMVSERVNDDDSAIIFSSGKKLLDLGLFFGRKANVPLGRSGVQPKLSGKLQVVLELGHGVA